MFRRLWTSPPVRTSRKLIKAEWGLLATLAIASGLVLAFLRIADEVVEQETHTFDMAILSLFRDPNNINDVAGPLWLQEMVRDLTSLGSFAILGLIVCVVVVYLLLEHKRAAAWLVLASVLGGTLLSTLLKMGYDRPRPELTQLSHQFTASFPSGHAMLSAVTFLTIGTLMAELARRRSEQIFAISAALVLTFIVGISRLYMGVHYPSDVLAGWCLGAAWALFCGAIADLLQRRGMVEEPGETTEQRKDRQAAP